MKYCGVKHNNHYHKHAFVNDTSFGYHYNIRKSKGEKEVQLDSTRKSYLFISYPLSKIGMSIKRLKLVNGYWKREFVWGRELEW